MASSSPLPGPERRKTEPAVRFREATFSDYAQIAALEARHNLDVKPYDRWCHLWLGNPVYLKLEPNWPIGWVLEETGGRIVGSIGNIPLAYQLAGRSLIAASGRACVVEQEFRSRALPLVESVVHQPGIDLYIDTSVTPESLPAVEYLECQRVPVGAWDESAFWITGYRGLVKGALAHKSWLWPRLASYPLGSALYLKDRLTGPRLLTDDFEVKEVQNFESLFDEFWLRLRSNLPETLLAVRSRQMLNWHFKYALQDRSLWIAAVIDGSRLAAYAIFDRRDNPILALKRIRIVDFQSLNGSSTLLPSLVAWALKKCRRERIHMLEFTGRWVEPGELAHTFAPHRRKLPTWTYFYRGMNSATAEALREPRAWAPTLYDGNSTL